MKRMTPLMLAIVTCTAQAGPESMFNPLTMGGGFPMPYGAYPGYGNPLGGYGNPLANMNTLSALASLGLIAAPLVAPLAPALLNPMGGFGGGVGQFGYPAMQMAPNMMSYGHYSQYGGGPFGGNPYLQRSLPNPLAPPAFSPSMPTLPFSPSQGTLPLPFPAPAPAPSPAAAPAFPALSSLPFLVAPMQQATLPPPGLVPGLSPMTPAAPAAQASAATPWSGAPDPAPKPEAAAASKQAEAAVAPAPATPMPFDPTALMQMFMKPMEAVSTPPAPAK